MYYKFVSLELLLLIYSLKLGQPFYIQKNTKNNTKSIKYFFALSNIVFDINCPGAHHKPLLEIEDVRNKTGTAQESIWDSALFTSGHQS